MYLGCITLSDDSKYIYCEVMTTIKLINTCTTSHTILCVCVWWEEYLRSILSKFHTYNTVLLTIVTMLSFRSPQLLPLTTEGLYHLTSSFLFPPLPIPWQPPFYSLLLWVQLFHWYCVCEIRQYLSFCVWLTSSKFWDRLTSQQRANLQIIRQMRLDEGVKGERGI